MRTAAGAVAATAERTARPRELRGAARARCQDLPDPNGETRQGTKNLPTLRRQRTHWRKTRKEGVRRRQHKPELEKKGVHRDKIEKEEKR
ncbi:hypothetical protein NDU88_002025 [Pleurodeles waltl]|uniref:Secreted protein n=1 Tax=Pleurodeles waltl TaxID=8319 RepID=A0AAV7LBA3_PLEWA|nr:hypothetical protein NDU88_002025 [Pleurodeles waltl]